MQIQGYEFNISAGRLEETLGGYLLHGKHVQIGHPFGRTMFFKHGWQSWSEAAWVSLKENPRPILPPERRPQCDDPAYALSPVHGGSGLGGLEGYDGRMLLLGALRPGVRIEADRLSLKGTCDHEMQWFLAYGEAQQILSRYAELLATTLGVRAPQAAPRVWCSWYSYYSDISEGQLLQTIAGLQGLPFEVFQVDDGWQQNMGDWEPNHKFPSGMSAIALRAQSQGLTPGLWLAPFIARPSSNLFKEHPDWFLRDEQGELVSAGTNWGGYYALDVTLPAVQYWLRSLIQTVRGWGYRYLKLDFLFAAALPGKRSGGESREDAYREALRILREAAGDDVYILACGAPIIASLGLVDGIRIGPDVAPYWDNEDRRLFLHDPTGPSVYNALRTSLHRLWLRPLVHTDPDVAYFRSRYNLLTPAQRAVLQDLALVAGFKATSDPPEWLDGEEREQLREWLEATPPITQTGPYAFKIGEREVDLELAVVGTPDRAESDEERLYRKNLSTPPTFEVMMHKRTYHKKDGRLLYLYGLAPHTLPALEEGENTGQAQSHARWHPLRQEWVVFAASRQGRTFLPPKEYDPLAPSKPGGFPTEIPFEDFEIAVFQNRWPSLSPYAGDPPQGLLIPTRDAQGDCEVVVYTPEHSGSIASLAPERRELLVQVWADRYRDLYARENIQYVMPFENRGEQIGVTLHHPHGQIYAYPWIPPILQKELEAFQQSPVLLDLLPHLSPYTVLEDEHTLACIPPYARYPYEVLVFPKRFHPGLWTFSEAETRSFARLLGQVVQKLDNLFQKPMPYVMALHAAPKGAETVFHFHVEFYPALRTADKLKYLAGTEIAAGTFAMDALPEETAKVLREVAI